MPKYRFLSILSTGTIQHGEIDALSPEDAMRELEERGLERVSVEMIPIDGGVPFVPTPRPPAPVPTRSPAPSPRPTPVRPVGAPSRRQSIAAWWRNVVAQIPVPWRRISLETLCAFFREICALSQAGIQVGNAFETLGKQLDPRDPLTPVVSEILVRLRNGEDLSGAMERFPSVFSPQALAMIGAGEASGDLATALERVAASYESKLRLLRSVVGSLSYPVLVLVFSVGIVLALLQFALPPFLQIFETQKIPLPPITQGFLTLFAFASSRQFLALLVMGGIGLAVAGRSFLRDPENRRKIEQVLFSLPGLGRLFAMVVAGRFCQVMGELYGSGIGLIRSLHCTAPTTGSLLVQDALQEVSGHVMGGEPLSRALEESRLFPSLVTMIVTVGEQTGKLDVVLAKASRFYDQEIALALRSVERLIEPVVLLMLGILMGIFILVFFLPIYSAIGSFPG